MKSYTFLLKKKMKYFDFQEKNEKFFYSFCLFDLIHQIRAEREDFYVLTT